MPQNTEPPAKHAKVRQWARDQKSDNKKMPSGSDFASFGVFSGSSKSAPQWLELNPANQWKCDSLSLIR
jgi:hypothetical protein